MDNEPVLSGAIITFIVALVTLLTTTNLVQLTSDQVILVTSAVTSVTHLIVSILVRANVVPLAKLTDNVTSQKR